MKTLQITLIATLSLSLLNPLFAEEPIAKDGSIRIKPGDSLIVQFDKAGDKLINPRLVEKKPEGIYVVFQAASTFGDKPITPKNPNSLLTFMMGESPNHTILMVQKSMEGTLGYDCEVRREGDKKMNERNNLPIKDKMPMLEQYPEKLDLIVLKNFKTE